MLGRMLEPVGFKEDLREWEEGIEVMDGIV